MCACVLIVYNEHRGILEFYCYLFLNKHRGIPKFDCFLFDNEHREIWSTNKTRRDTGDTTVSILITGICGSLENGDRRMGNRKWGY